MSTEDIIRLGIIAAASGFAAFIYILFRKAQENSRKRAEQKRKEDIERKNRKLTDAVNKRIAAFNKTIQDIMMKAISYGDEVTPERIEEVVDGLQDIVTNVHEYKKLMDAISEAEKQAEKISSDMEIHEKELEEFRKEQAQKAEKEAERYPYRASRYFRTCHDMAEVKKMFRRLAKVYHPDCPGGSAEKYMDIQDEYRRITGRSR